MRWSCDRSLPWNHKLRRTHLCQQPQPRSISRLHCLLTVRTGRSVWEYSTVRLLPTYPCCSRSVILRACTSERGHRSIDRSIGSGLVALWMHCGHLLYVCRRYGILQPSVVLGPSYVYGRRERLPTSTAGASARTSSIMQSGQAPPRPARLLPSQPYRARTTENTRECR